MAVYLIESKADQQKLIDYVGEKTAKLFFSMKDRLKSPENDMYYWLKREPSELEDRLSELQSTKTRSQRDNEASKGAELIYNKDGWKVYHITTYEASVKYGKNTRWCIAGSKDWDNGERGEEYFNDYVERGIEFYFYIRGNKKYALAYTGEDEDYQVFNAEDEDITNDDLSFLPNVIDTAYNVELPRFNLDEYTDLVDSDGVFIYTDESMEIPIGIRGKIKKVIISEGIERVGTCAFEECYNLKSIEFPRTLVKIGQSAFYDCESLEEIVFPNNVEIIQYAAFSECTSLKKVVLPNKLKVLDGYVFSHTQIKSLQIPDSVEALVSDSINRMSSLESLLVPEAVKINRYSINIKTCPNLTIYTDNEDVIDYCKVFDIPYKPASEFPG